ncbi:MAG: dual specificity protein phosphatase family protein [Candidatus Latescibacterota bacterium]
MLNAFWLLPGLLAGRPGPTREPWSLRQIRDAGIRAVVNLSEFPPRQSEFAEHGIEVLWVPLPATVPADAQSEQSCLERLPRAYAFLVTHLQAGHPVLVHCYAGCDRTGMLLAYHAARAESLSPRQAIQRVRQVRPAALTAQGWEAMAVRVIEALVAGAAGRDPWARG